MRKSFWVAAAMLWSLSSWAAVEANTASEAELDGVKGLGPSSTARILVARKQGAFKDWRDFLHRVSGIKAASAAKLSANGLTVNGEAYMPAKQPSHAGEK